MLSSRWIIFSIIYWYCTAISFAAPLERRTERDVIDLYSFHLRFSFFLFFNRERHKTDLLLHLARYSDFFSRSRSRYRGNRCITKMKPFDLIERLDDSSAFGYPPHLFPLPLRSPFPTKRIVSIATTFPHLPSFLSRRDKLFFLAVSFVAPWRGGPEVLVTVCRHRKRTSLRRLVVDPGVSHVL